MTTRPSLHLYLQNVLRLENSAFLGGAASLVLVGYMSCSQRALAVFLLSLCMCFAAFNLAGYSVNHVDLAPRHAGVMYGSQILLATIPGMIAPLVVGALTPNAKDEGSHHLHPGTDEEDCAPLLGPPTRNQSVSDLAVPLGLAKTYKPLPFTPSLL
ncbi:sialin-like [Babylonia areolata]|uniref:sialin-like n=1 Tax=Babylonia areolata TaxID=304850 RepID=UPI003FD2E148